MSKTIEKPATEAVDIDRLVRRYSGPEHAGDQKCPICGAWGATQLTDCGGAGISQWRYVCPACEYDRFHSANDPDLADSGEDRMVENGDSE